MVSTRTTTVLLGLTAATSLFLLSTAFPVALPPQRLYPYDSLSSSSSSSSQQSYGHFYAQDPYSRQIKEQVSEDDNLQQQQPPHLQPQQPRPYPLVSKGGESDGLRQNTHSFQDLLLTRPSSAPLPQHHRQEQEQESALRTPSSTSSSLPSSWSSSSSSSSSSTSPPHSSFPSRHPTQPSLSSQHHQHDLRVQTFKTHGPTPPQDQILHQCATHFLALLDTEISDRLLAQLSRLVMMLPVIGVETRAVIRQKVTEVMGSMMRGLKHYEAIERVIRTAVDDAGGLQLLQLTPSTRSTLGDGNSLRIGGREKELFEVDDSRNDQISEYDDVDDVSGGNSSNNNNSGEATATTPRMIDESQIPVITDIAMEAVLNYMAEILTPSLVIHQLTEAIQGALFEISKQRKALQRMRRERHSDSGADEDGYLEDANEVDLDLDDLSSQSLSSHRPADRHGVDLLSDGWVWSGPSSRDKDGSSRDNSVNSLFEEDEKNEDDDPLGQDEDLWDNDMETHQWDSTGHLFEDFEDEDTLLNNDASSDSSSQTVMSKPATQGITKQDMEKWDMTAATLGDDDGEDGEGENDDESSDPYSIGIRESDDGTGNDNDGGDGAEDEKDSDDPMADTSEDYGRERYLQQSYFNRFQKRSLFASSPASHSDAAKQPEPQKAAATAGAPSLRII
ncbi:hypothetical protein BGZ47_002681, partial [Haplosporangium gracile]